ncbi:OmpA family protein [Bacteroidales bacterium OttesenSCG-928-M06]|nr:OmpA family protein [Bacteroidales bacterium OttesenSCG-928-M06]
MKRRSLFLILFILPFTLVVKAQDRALSVEKQYPGDEKAYTIYDKYEQIQLDSTSTALRTTWIANRPIDNWFISAGAGAAVLMSEETRYMDFKDQINFPTFQFSVGKWFSPVWGLRVNVTGSKLQGFAINGHEGVGSYYFQGSWLTGKNYKNGTGQMGLANSYTDGTTQEGAQLIADRFLNLNDKKVVKEGTGYTYDMKYIGASLDFMLNLKNFFTAYNPKAFFNPVFYLGVGWAHTFKEDVDGLPENEGRTAVNNIMGKTGMQFNFRLGDRWDLFLDGQALILPEKFDRRVGDNMTVDFVANATLGLTYRFNFRHFIKAPVYEQCEVDELNRIINELRNRPEVVCPPVVICPEPEVEKEVLTPVFFTLDSYVVRDNQLISIAKAAQYLINNPNARIQIAGYADKNTGNPKHNMKLSENRSKAVTEVLVSRFGIDRNRIEITFFGDTVQPFDENDWNRVAIFIVP